MANLETSKMISLTENKLYSNGDYKAWNYCMEKLSNKVALDVGANEGGYVETLLNNGFHVHAFEPVPDMFEKMRAKYSDNKKVVLNNLGVSDHNYTLNDLTVINAWTLGRVNEFHGVDRVPEYMQTTFPVTFTTIDNYCKELSVGFIKIDVDGYEFKVLKGGEKTIRKQRPPMLFELSYLIPMIGDSVLEMMLFILDMDYQLMSLDGSFRTSNLDEAMYYYPERDSFDVLLMPKELSSKIAA